MFIYAMQGKQMKYLALTNLKQSIKRKKKAHTKTTEINF